MTFRPLETLARTVPLGLRCVDIATRSQVSDGLNLTALPVERVARPVAARLTRSGIYALHDLPGLRELEFTDSDATLSPPASVIVV